LKLLVTLFADEDGVFVAECPSIPGCVSQGKTEEEEMENVPKPSGTAWKFGPSEGCR
jgi:predicted RNase H-like HicB family nuclease